MVALVASSFQLVQSKFVFFFLIFILVRKICSHFQLKWLFTEMCRHQKLPFSHVNYEAFQRTVWWSLMSVFQTHTIHYICIRMSIRSEHNFCEVNKCDCKMPRDINLPFCLCCCFFSSSSFSPTLGCFLHFLSLRSWIRNACVELLISKLALSENSHFYIWQTAGPEVRERERVSQWEIQLLFYVCTYTYK